MLPFGCQALGSHPCVALSSWRWRLYQLSWGVDNSFFWMSRKIRETSYRRIGVPPDGVFYPLSETMGEVRAKTRAEIRAGKVVSRQVRDRIKSGCYGRLLAKWADPLSGLIPPTSPPPGSSPPWGVWGGEARRWTGPTSQTVSLNKSFPGHVHCEIGREIGTLPV